MRVQIEDFYRDGDGDDWLPAITRAQDSFHASAVAGDFRGFTLSFGPRTYRFTGSIQLIRGMNLSGSGGMTENAGTILQFGPNTDGIVANRLTTAPSETPGEGDWSNVEFLQVLGPGKTATGVASHGIRLYCRVALRSVMVNGFSGDGIHIEASVGGNPPTNANNWIIQDSRVVSCGGNGLYISGGDTNAGYALGLDTAENDGWGIFDNSFLGNTFVACSAATNGLGPYACEAPVTGHDAMSLFLNCYAEGDQPACKIDYPAMVIGGLLGSGVEGSAVWIASYFGVANFANGLRASNPDSSGPINERVAARIGGGVAGAAIELYHDATETALPIRLHYSKHAAANGWWELVYANLADLGPISISTEMAPEKANQVWFANGYFIGTPPNRRKVAIGAAPPSPTAPDGGFPWQSGDRVLNSTPTASQPWEGWICVEDPSASNPVGVWKGYGRIDGM
jgi:hypothetical protein